MAGLALRQMADYVTDVGALTQATSRLGATGLVVQQSTVSVFSVGDARVRRGRGYLSLMTDDQRLDDGSPVTQSIGGSGRRNTSSSSTSSLNAIAPALLVCSMGSRHVGLCGDRPAVTSEHPLDACTRLVNAAVDADSSVTSRSLWSMPDEIWTLPARDGLTSSAFLRQRLN